MRSTSASRPSDRTAGRPSSSRTTTSRGHATRSRADRPADRDAIAKAAAVLLLTLRGTPFLYYGEEIGLGDIRVPRREIVDPPARRYWPLPLWWNRDGCRAPMPWTAGPNGGFSSGPAVAPDGPGPGDPERGRPGRRSVLDPRDLPSDPRGPGRPAGPPGRRASAGSSEAGTGSWPTAAIDGGAARPCVAINLTGDAGPRRHRRPGDGGDGVGAAPVDGRSSATVIHDGLLGLRPDEAVILRDRPTT